MTFIETYLAGLGVIIAMMTLIWLVSLVVRDSSIVDIFWGAGFVIVATAYFIMTDGNETRSVITLILVALWGLRLTAHIGYRNIGKGEDFRYQKWREQYGAAYWRVSYLRVYVLQGVIMWIVSAPLLQAQFHGSPDAPSILDILGIIVWGVGFFFEAVGDWQLTRFKGDPANKGKVMNTGLWRYTRHPNYFGDAVVWWGLFLLALSTEGGILTIFSPLIMTFLLVRVSGVAMLEKSLKDKKPEYIDYIKRTSAFFPRPPQK